MKKPILVTLLVLLAGTAWAQEPSGQPEKDLPIVYVNEKISTHFFSPGTIQYVDLSTAKLAMDLPVKNILRIKPVLDSLKKAFGSFVPDQELGVVTVVGQKFMAQYQLVYAGQAEAQVNIYIRPEHMQPLDDLENPLSDAELASFCAKIVHKKTVFHAVKANAYGIKAQLNNVYSVGDYVFVVLSYRNKTNLKYDIDQIRFKIDDKKITKATNVQAVEILPVFTLNNASSFKKQYRNVFVFKKFTYPGGKVLAIELSEKQISGRTITLKLDYSDILNADSL